MIDRVAAVYFTHAAATRGDSRPPSLSALRDLAGARRPAPIETDPSGAPVDPLAGVGRRDEPAPLLVPADHGGGSRIDQFLSGPGAAPEPAPVPTASAAPAPGPTPAPDTGGPAWAVRAPVPPEQRPARPPLMTSSGPWPIAPEPPYDGRPTAGDATRR